MNPQPNPTTASGSSPRALVMRAASRATLIDASRCGDPDTFRRHLELLDHVAELGFATLVVLGDLTPTVSSSDPTHRRPVDLLQRTSGELVTVGHWAERVGRIARLTRWTHHQTVDDATLDVCRRPLDQQTIVLVQGAACADLHHLVTALEIGL
ncbi:hypothetical protein [Rubrivirga sp.]|uniref:hypothetical protein n=1 Tax=Rubrivirga sp. TaxID=1885344 RepID=UPI003C737B66